MKVKSVFYGFILFSSAHFINGHSLSYDAMYEAYRQNLTVEGNVARTCLELDKQKKLTESERKTCEIAYRMFMATLAGYFAHLNK